MQANSLLLIGLFAVVGCSNGYYVIPYERAIDTSGEETDGPEEQENSGSYTGCDEDGPHIGDYYRRGGYDPENNPLRILTDDDRGAGSVTRSIYGSRETRSSVRTLLGEEKADTKANLRGKQWVQEMYRRISNHELSPRLYYNQRADDVDGYVLETNSGKPKKWMKQQGISNLRLPARSAGPHVYYYHRAEDIDGNGREIKSSETKQGNSNDNSSHTKKQLMLSCDAIWRALMMSNGIRRKLNDQTRPSRRRIKDGSFYLDLADNSARQKPVIPMESEDMYELVPKQQKSQNKKTVSRKLCNNWFRHLQDYKIHSL